MNRLDELRAKTTLSDDEKVELKKLETEAKETLFLEKIKEIVNSQMEEKLANVKKDFLVGDAGDERGSRLVAKALMTEAQTKSYSFMNEKKQKDFEENLIVLRFFQAQKLGNEVMAKDLSEGTDSEGGYLVPEPLQAKIYEIIDAEGHARREMSVIPMTSKTLDLSTLATKPTVYYVAEGAQITQSDIAFGRKTLTAEKVAGITVMSNELLSDANMALIPYITQKFAEAFTEEEDKAFFNTSSASGITGILEDTGTNVVTMGTGDVDFDDVGYDDLIDVVYTLKAKHRKKAKWCFSSYITSLVMKFKDQDNNPIWSRAVEGEPARLLGYPIIENDEMPELADTAVSTKFLVFGNFKKYIVGDRMKTTAKVLTEGTVGSTNLAEKDSIGLRLVRRVSGIAPTPLDFVVLRTAAV